MFERKFDGQRLCAVSDPDQDGGQRGGRQRGEVRLHARSGTDITLRYPDVLRGLPRDRAYVVDGELVVFQNGRESFSLLQRRMHARNPDLDVPVRFVVFDCLNLDGYDTRGLPYEVRHGLVKQIGLRDPAAAVPHTRGDARVLLERACEAGWEGLVAKRADSVYESRRSGRWLKLKCARTGDFVIGGYTDPKGSRVGFGALLLGEPTKKGLVFVGKVGTGFDTRQLQVLHAGLRRIRRDSSPFAEDPLTPATGRPLESAGWVEPVLVCRVEYTEWTPDGRLRHPRFVGLVSPDARQERTHKREVAP